MGTAEPSRRGPGEREPVDPDIDLHLPSHRAETAGHGLWKVLAVVAAGGVLGALARFGATELWPARWAVLGANVVGCALIGGLMVLVTETGSAHPLVRPFLGTGVLGGFTTFSAYAVDFAELLREERAWTALGYAFGTLAGALGAVWAAASLTRRAVASSSRRTVGAR